MAASPGPQHFLGAARGPVHVVVPGLGGPKAPAARCSDHCPMGRIRGSGRTRLPLDRRTHPGIADESMVAEAWGVVRALPCWVGAQARGRALDQLVELGTNVRLVVGRGSGDNAPVYGGSRALEGGGTTDCGASGRVLPHPQG